MQVNFDPGSFDTGVGARDAAQEAKRGAEIVAPLRAGLPTESGAAQSSVLAAAGAVVRQRWWPVVRASSCVVVVVVVF
jgi:hypothetical protein